jgi:DNA polymerase-3 subunit beta
MAETMEKKAGSKAKGTADEQAEVKERKGGEKSAIFKASAGDLLKVLQKIAGGAGRNKTLPILGHVLIAKDGSSLRFTATDMEQQLSVETELGASAGKTTVTAEMRKLMDILKAISPEVMTTMVSDGVKSQITAGKSKFTVGSLEATDFPLMTEATYDVAVTLKQGTLRSMIDDVSYAMAVHDVRFYLMGMLLETDGKSVYAVATDGNRLAMAEALLEQEAAKRKIILPSRAIHEMAKLLSDGAEDVELRLSSNQASMTMGDVRLVTKLIEGRFPDYQRVLPSSVKTSVTFEREELSQALRRAALMTDEKFKGVRLKFKENELTLAVNNAHGESVSEKVGIDYEGEEVELGMNVTFLADAVENVTGDTVTIGLRSGQDSILITQAKNPNFRGVVMPMRI